MTWFNGKVVSPGRHAVGGCAQSSSSKDTQAEAEVHKGRISLTRHRLLPSTKVPMSHDALNEEEN